MSNTENKFQDIENPRNAYHESMMSAPGAEQHYDSRHPATRQIMRWLLPNINLPEDQQAVARSVWRLADGLLDVLPDGPELTAGLRKLLEAKDCFVRQSLGDEGLTS